jgi:purine-binding chemotaxis protein CheW
MIPKKKKSSNMQKKVSAAPKKEDEPLSTKSQEILKTRAQELAAEHKEEIVAEDSLEVLEFILASEHYGVESCFIREVFPMKEYTPIPGTPEFVLGLINIRGQIVSVIDIRRFFDLPNKGMSDLNRVIVINTPVMEMGILADRSVGVRNISRNALQTSLPTLTGVRAEYLRGVTPEGLIVLDIQKMVSDNKLIINEEIE